MGHSTTNTTKQERTKRKYERSNQTLLYRKYFLNEFENPGVGLKCWKEYRLGYHLNSFS